MNELSGTYEFTVTQKSEGKYRLRRIGLILLYAIYVIAFFAIFALTIPYLIALVPVTLWIIWFFTWRYVSIEYEYSMTSGMLTFSKIYGGRSRKQVFDVQIKTATRIAPLDDNGEKELEEYKPEAVYDARSSTGAEDAYFMTFENADGKRCVYLFEATAQALKVLKYYNSSTVVTQVRR